MRSEGEGTQAGAALQNQERTVSRSKSLSLSRNKSSRMMCSEDLGDTCGRGLLGGT